MSTDDSATWDGMAATWDDDPIVRAYSAAAFTSLQDALAARGTSLSGSRVLDFGSGTGLLTAAMAAQAERVVALDVSSAMLAVLDRKELPNVETVCGPLHTQRHSPMLAPRTFDLVTCSSVCAFLADYPEAVRQLAGLLAPGGWFVQWDWALDPTAETPMGFTPETIRAALQGAGLVDLSVGVGFQVPIEGHTMAPLMGLGRQPT